MHRQKRKKEENMQIIYKSPKELTPYPNNAKQHPPKQVEHIVNSIKQFGWQQPIVIDKDNVVIIGHGRLMAALEMGLDIVPVVCADTLTEEQVNALRLADNKTNESGWDFGKLEEELAQLAIDGIDMAQFGFDDMEGAPSLLDAMQEDFGIAGEAKSMGTVTLTFDDPNDAEEVKSFIRKNDMSGICIAVLDYVRGYNA